MVAVADHGARQAVLVRLNIISDLFAERGLKHFELGLSSGAGAADAGSVVACTHGCSRCWQQ